MNRMTPLISDSPIRRDLGILDMIDDRVDTPGRPLESSAAGVESRTKNRKETLLGAERTRDCPGAAF